MKVIAKAKVENEWLDVWHLISPTGVPSKSDKTIKKFIHNASSDSMTHNAGNSKMVNASCIESKVLDWTDKPVVDQNPSSKKYPISSIEIKYEVLDSGSNNTTIICTLDYQITKGSLGRLLASMSLTAYMKSLAKRNLADLTRVLEKNKRVAA